MKQLKTTIVLLLLGSIFYSTQAQDPTLNLAFALNATSGSSTTIKKIVKANGYIYVTGGFAGTVDFDPGSGTVSKTSVGNNDFFLAKYDSIGNYVWAFSWGTTQADIGYSLKLDGSGNIYVVGQFGNSPDFDPSPTSSTIINLGTATHTFLAKYDGSGNFVWVKGFGVALKTDNGYDLALDASGNIFITGITSATSPGTDYDPGSGTTNLITNGLFDIVIAKYDASGNYIWAKNIGSTGADTPYSLGVDASGNVYLTGSFTGTVDFDPSASTVNLTSAGGVDIFLAKYDGSGNYVWANRVGGVNTDIGYGLALDGSGNVYVTGTFSTTVDFDPGSSTASLTEAGGGAYRDIFLAKYDGSGAYIWAKRMGGYDNDDGLAVVLDASGNAYVTGQFYRFNNASTPGTPISADFDPGTGSANLTSVGLYDTFIGKYDSSGNYVWAKSFGAASNDYGYSVALDANNNLLVVGGFSGTIDFDPGSGTTNLTSTGTQDGFIASFASPVSNSVGAASSTPTLCINTTLTNITHATSGATGIGTATGLPAGVSVAWASNTITISGTPSAAGTYNYSIPLTGGIGSVNATGTITVIAANTAGAASSSPALCINTALTDVTHATTGATGIGTATGLPSGVTAGWASNTITISGTPTVSGTFNYSIPLTGGCSAVNATGTIFVSPLFSWTGTGGNDLWSNAANWSTGTVPTTSSTIVISSGHPNLNQHFEVGGSLTLSNTGSLTISSGYTLSVAAGGVADFGGKSVTFKSDATGSGQLGAVAGTLSNATNVTVERHIPSGIRAFRFLTSPVTTTSSIRQNWMEGSSAGVWSGYPYTANTTYNLNPGYGTQITGSGGPSNGFDETLFNNPSLFSFNNSSGAWEAITSTTGTITAGTAYRMLVRGDRSYNMALNYEPVGGATILRTTGTLAQGQLTTGSQLPALSNSADGWSLVGNPYQSVVDLYSSDVVKTNLTEYYYIWDPRQANRGAYVAYNMSLATGGSNNLSSGMTRFVQPGQAFFVQNTAAGNGSMVFKEAAKGSASEQTATFGSGNTGVDYSSLSAQLFYTDSLAVGHGSMDGIRVLFGKRFSNAVNAGDGRKFTNPDETMSIKRNADNMSMELRSTPDTATVVPLSISQYRVKRYTLRFAWDQPLAEEMVAIVKDKYLGKETQINQSGYTDVEYVLDGQSASSAADRFAVEFKSTAINLSAIAGTAEVCVGTSSQLFNTTPGGTWSSKNPSIVSIDANGNFKGNSIGSTELVYTVSRYGNTKSVSQIVTVGAKPVQPTITRNADGQLLSNSTTGNQWYNENGIIAGANASQYKPTNPSYYRVRVAQNGCVSELSNSYYYTTGPLLDAASGSFVRIFPNPVQSDVKIEFMLKEKNVVRVEVYDMKGKRVLEYKNVLTGSKINMTSLAAGVYRFRVMSNNGMPIYSYTVIKK